jgi:MFS transporter, DHA2 family, multidrug resistance protein
LAASTDAQSERLRAIAAWRPSHNPWLIALAVSLATFMEVLDTSIANVALPHIAGSLGASTDESTWVLTSYLVSNGIILPLSAWFSNVLGRKRFYMIWVGIFTISSFLCGIAPSLTMLIFFRVVQGLGGGGLQPSAQAILADSFPPAKRGMAFAIYGLAVVFAPAIGPTLGGWITDNFDWRWIFLINIPVGIIALLATSRLIEDPPHILEAKKTASLKVDYIGIGLLALGFGCLQVVLDKGQQEDWFDSHFIVWFTGIAVVCLVVAVFWELRHSAPVVDLSLFRDTNFAVATGMMFMLGFVLLGSTLMLPLFTQTLLGYDATTAGMAISPGGVVIMFFMPVVGFLLQKMQPRLLIAFGLAITGWSILHMTEFTLGVDFHTVVMARIYQSIGMAFMFVPISTIAYAYIPPGKNNAASALINLARNIGGSFGIAFVATLLARRAQFHQSVLVSHLDAGNPQVQGALQGMTQLFGRLQAGSHDALHQAYGLLMGQVQRQATMLAFVDTFQVLGWTFLAMLPFVFLLRRVKGGKGGSMAAH